MMELILEAARRDDRIRVVGLNGSRVNPKAARDAFQDYDVAYLVTDLDGLKNDERWLDIFGPRVILQKPEAMSLFPSTPGKWFSYLMLLEDGNRIDIMLIPLDELKPYLAADQLTVILLDKDHRLAPLPPPSDETHWVPKPSEQCVNDCCNEFWWLAPYVAKGLCRREMLYAIDHLNMMRQQLLLMISWRVGLDNDFAVDAGKNYKYLDQYMPAEEFQALLSTFRNDSPEVLAAALQTCLNLFRASSRSITAGLSYAYPDYDEKVSAYLEGIIVDDKRLP